MDLEARSLQPSIKATLLSKLREYRNDLNNLKSEVKRITSGNANQAARDELLGSGMADARMVIDTTFFSPKCHHFELNVGMVKQPSTMKLFFLLIS